MKMLSIREERKVRGTGGATRRIKSIVWDAVLCCALLCFAYLVSVTLTSPFQCAGRASQTLTSSISLLVFLTGGIS